MYKYPFSICIDWSSPWLAAMIKCFNVMLSPLSLSFIQIWKPQEYHTYTLVFISKWSYWSNEDDYGIVPIERSPSALANRSTLINPASYARHYFNQLFLNIFPLIGRIKTMSSDLESSQYALSIRRSISLIGSIFCQTTQLNRPLESQCRARARNENRHSRPNFSKRIDIKTTIRILVWSGIN